MANGKDGFTKDTKLSVSVMISSASLIVAGFWVALFLTTAPLREKMDAFADDLREIRDLVKDGDANVRANTMLVVELRAQIQALQQRIVKLENK